MPYVNPRYQTRAQREHTEETGNNNIPTRFLTRNQKAALSGTNRTNRDSRTNSGTTRKTSSGKHVFERPSGGYSDRNEAGHTYDELEKFDYQATKDRIKKFLRW